jgi:hypothetical protein
MRGPPVHPGMRTLVCALALMTALATSADAHPLDVGYLRVQVAGSDIEVSLDLDATQTNAPSEMSIAGCPWVAERTQTVARTFTRTRTARCSELVGERVLEVPFLRHMPERFQLLAQQGSSTLALVDRASAQVRISADAGHTHVGLAAFIASGVAHIGAAPSEWRDASGGWQLPDGIDHILFLLGLLLGGGTLLRLVGVASGFTIGHSITLALAALGVVSVPSWIIEPLIALSIAFVAIEALTQRLAAHRWKIALGFGLVHGFGFANALTELQLDTGAMVQALAGYNLGVELGQLAIVMLLAPLVLAAHRRRWSHVWILRPAAIAIGLAGLYWFVQRVAG